MKNVLFIITLSILFVSNLNAQNYEHKSYKQFYKDGSIRIEGQLESRFKIIESDDEKDWFKSGEWTYYYPNGVIWLNGNYNRNELIGEWVANYPNGKPFIKGRYEQYFLNSENLLMNNEFRYARSVGEWISFWEDGKIANIYTFDDEGTITTQVVNTKYVDNYPYPSGKYGQGETALSISYTWNYAKQPFIDIVASTFEKDYEGNVKINLGNFFRYGKWKQYYPTGELNAQGNYNWKTNAANGKWILYHKNGQKYQEKTFVNDTITGVLKQYYKTGALESEGYSIGIEKNKINRNGVFTGYYQNGKIKYVKKYENDFTIGSIKLWDEEGNLIENSIGYGNGKIHRKYFKNNILISEGEDIWSDKENKYLKDGLWSYYYDNGDKWKVEIYKNGLHKGYWEQFLEDGEQILNNGSGVYKTFYDTGALRMSSEHKDGSRDGITTWYYPNGQVKQSAVYKFDISSKPYGLRWEILSSFTSDGIPRDKGTLKNGTGSWINYTNEGNVSNVNYYRNGRKIE